MADPEVFVRTYDAAAAPRGTLRHILPLLRYPEVIWENRNLVANFTRRELLGRFRGSILGSFWVLVQPLFLFLIYYLIFGLLYGNQRAGQPPDPNFAFYLFSGMISFSALNEATTNHCSAVVGNGNLVKKVAFPSEVLPIPGTLVAQAIYLVGALVLLIAWAGCWAMGVEVATFQPGFKLLLLPVTLALQFAMILGLGLLLANLYVFVRDIRHLWGIFVMAWMFLSPVFWQPNMVLDKPWAEQAEWFFALNPAYSLIMAQRICLGATDAVTADGSLLQFGDLTSHLLRTAAWAGGFLLLGFGSFMSRKHRYADLV